MVPTIFLDTFVAESVMQNAPSYSGSGDGVVTVDYAVPVDRLALKYVGRSVYVLERENEGQSGHGAVDVGRLGTDFICKCDAGWQRTHVE